MSDKKEIIKTREDKMVELNIPSDKWIAFTDTAIDFMYDKICNANAIMSKEEERLIYFINKMLIMIGCDRIYRISDFMIDRIDIVKLNGEDFVNQHKEKLIEYGIHINNNLYFLHRKKMKSYGLTVLKGLCKFFGFNLISKNKLITDKEGKHISVYYIISKESKNNDNEE